MAPRVQLTFANGCGSVGSAGRRAAAVLVSGGLGRTELGVDRRAQGFGIAADGQVERPPARVCGAHVLGIDADELEQQPVVGVVERLPLCSGRRGVGVSEPSGQDVGAFEQVQCGGGAHEATASVAMPRSSWMCHAHSCRSAGPCRGLTVSSKSRARVRRCATSPSVSTGDSSSPASPLEASLLQASSSGVSGRVAAARRISPASAGSRVEVGEAGGSVQVLDGSGDQGVGLRHRLGSLLTVSGHSSLAPARAR